MRIIVKNDPMVVGATVLSKPTLSKGMARALSSTMLQTRVLGRASLNFAGAVFRDAARGLCSGRVHCSRYCPWRILGCGGSILAAGKAAEAGNLDRAGQGIPFLVGETDLPDHRRRKAWQPYKPHKPHKPVVSKRVRDPGQQQQQQQAR